MKSTSRKQIILIGAGGHCRSVIDVILKEDIYDIAGIVDDSPEKIGSSLDGFKVIGTGSDLKKLIADYKYFLVTIGQIKDPSPRVKYYELIKQLKGELPTIISPLAYVSPRSSVDAGSVVMHCAIINAGATVGANCILNTRSLVEHDAKVGDHSHISTGAILNGGANVGSRTFVGSQSVVREYINVPDGTVIGAGQFYRG